MAKLNGKSLDLKAEQLKRIQEIAPETVRDGVVDFEHLKKELEPVLDPKGERYGLSWAGKGRCFAEIQKQTTATLLPEPDESVDFNSARNVFIEGENLEVLKVLQKSYYGKVKMIYIDPPYNTGHDFVYHDSFEQGDTEYIEQSGDGDGDGNRVRDFRRNAKEGGRFHSNWLNMMYPRLYLARNLLRTDGVVFISIDDNEAANLRLVMDEIFGEENFIASIEWQKKQSPQNDSTYLSSMHDHILVYAKLAKQNRNSPDGWQMRLLARTEEQEARYENPDGDERGPWISVDMSSNKTATQRPNLYYPVINPATGAEVLPSKKRVWRYSQEVMETLLREGRIWWGADGEGFPRQKRYLSEVQAGVIPSTWWTREFAGDNQAAKRELRSIFSEGEEVFDTPKPTKLIRRMLEISTEGEDLVLDFFAGSATTGHAVMAQNLEDGGKRRFLLVQLPEETDPEGEARQAGYDNIAQISRARLQRVITGYGDSPERIEDVGFKAFRLAKSNFPVWKAGPMESEEELTNAVKEQIEAPLGGDTNARLYELIIKLGSSLDAKIEESNGVYWVDGTELAISLVEVLSNETIATIASMKPKVFVCRDSAFEKDEDKTNALLRFRDAGIGFRTI